MWTDQLSDAGLRRRCIALSRIRTESPSSTVKPLRKKNWKRPQPGNSRVSKPGRLQNEASLAQDKQEILQKALDELAAEKLIEAEAAKEKKTKEQLLEAEVDSNVDTPSAEEVEAFYEANKERIPIPKDQALPQVKHT